jgi:hypothetical protein
MPTKTLTSPFARPRWTEQDARDALAALGSPGARHRRATAGGLARRPQRRLRTAASDSVPLYSCDWAPDALSLGFGESGVLLPAVPVTELAGQKGSLVELDEAVVRRLGVSERLLRVRHLGEPRKPRTHGKPRMVESPWARGSCPLPHLCSVGSLLPRTPTQSKPSKACSFEPRLRCRFGTSQTEQPSRYGP